MTAVDARAARVVWNTADTQWTTLWVETGCARTETCSNVQLTVDAAYAEAVWGAPAHGAHRPAIGFDVPGEAAWPVASTRNSSAWRRP
ncbi:hypothetical protein [Amycolatopsis sp. lyj-108]|uniref:hypothetical protein n=1 Tax=Amycolatopsis sp. lyj-108 TaxID=2789286 RepID=UPI003979144E